jgi:hypothetical protein
LAAFEQRSTSFFRYYRCPESKRSPVGTLAKCAPIVGTDAVHHADWLAGDTAIRSVEGNRHDRAARTYVRNPAIHYSNRVSRQQGSRRELAGGERPDGEKVVFGKFRSPIFEEHRFPSGATTACHATNCVTFRPIERGSNVGGNRPFDQLYVWAAGKVPAKFTARNGPHPGQQVRTPGAQGWARPLAEAQTLSNTTRRSTAAANNVLTPGRVSGQDRQLGSVREILRYI